MTVWAEAARILGVRFEGWRTGGTRLYGRVDQHRIEMVTPFYGVVTTGEFALAADLGLEVVRSGRGDDIKTGHQEFDALFRLRGDEPDLIRRIFSPDFAATLIQQGMAHHSLQISDYGARLSRSDFTGEEYGRPGIFGRPRGVHSRDIVEDYTRMAWLLRALTVQFACTPGPTPLLSHVEAWRNFAGAHQLSFSESPLAFWGRLHDAHIGAQPVRVAPGAYQLRASLQHATPLGLGLQLRRGSRSVLGSLFGSAVQTGDEEFDALYEAKAEEPEVAAKLLDAPARRLLADLARSYERVTITDLSMVVDCGPLDDPAEALTAIEAMQQVSSALVTRSAPVASPYR